MPIPILLPVQGKEGSAVAPRNHSTTKCFPATLAGGNTPSKPGSRWLFRACFAEPRLCCNSSKAAAVCPGQGKGWSLFRRARGSPTLPGLRGAGGPHAWNTGGVSLKCRGTEYGVKYRAVMI